MQYESYSMITAVGLVKSVVAKTPYNKMLPSAFAGGVFYRKMC